MKIEKKDFEHEFKPFTIYFTIESEEEKEAIREMFSLNVTIPDNIILGDREIVKCFMDKMLKLF
jgi:dimeric dUTPase (all-alpha-NTP-PPase superfamily)